MLGQASQASSAYDESVENNVLMGVGSAYKLSQSRQSVNQGYPTPGYISNSIANVGLNAKIIKQGESSS